MQPRVIAAAAAAMVLAAGSAAAADVEVIFSRAPESPTSIVPGAVDNNGDPVETRFNSMLDFWLSPDGSKWLLRGATAQATTADAYLLLGAGSGGAVVLQDGRPFPGAVGNEVVDFFSSTNMMPFNENNEWAVALRARGGVSANAQKIVRFSSDNIGVLRFQQGDLYKGLEDSGNPSGDEIVGNSIGTVHLLNDGTIGTHDTTIGNIHTSRRPAITYDLSRYLQVNVDSVPDLGGVSRNIQGISSTGTISVFGTSPDGSVRVVRGTITRADPAPVNPAVVIVNEEVKIEVGAEIPGTGVTPTAVNQTFVAANGDWYARGADAAGAWATRNGAVIARTGDSIGDDNWGPTFLTIAGNRKGDWLIAGKSDRADTATDDVLVVNGQVVLREGDEVPIDLDGDGTMDVAYVGRGNNTLAAFGSNTMVGLAPDRTVYIVAFLRDAAGADLAPSGTPYALLRISADEPCAADFNGDGQLTVDDFTAFRNAFLAGDPAADFNGDGSLTVADFAAFRNAFLAGCG